MWQPRTTTPPSVSSTTNRWILSAGELRRGAPGVYINFVGNDLEVAVREAYLGATWDRLVEVKTKYDQENLFASNHIIPPRD